MIRSYRMSQQLVRLYESNNATVTVNGQKKDEAMRFLKGKSFHQNLRNEILFGLIPKTLKPDSSQNNPLGHLIDRLKISGYWAKNRILELLTVRKFRNHWRNSLSYFPQYTVDQCVDFGKYFSRSLVLTVNQRTVWFSDSYDSWSWSFVESSRFLPRRCDDRIC